MSIDWKPIETAPKDGTVILLFTPGCPPGYETAYWANPGYWIEAANEEYSIDGATAWAELHPPSWASGNDRSDVVATRDRGMQLSD